MTTPTPGPWKVNKTWGTIEGPRLQEICAIFPADESGRREPRATAQANAQLIAAAPDMLAALKVSLHEINELKRALADEIGSNRASIYYQLGQAARDAISKAEGA